MPNVNLNSINSSISYAEEIVDKIVSEDIIYSFFMGNVVSSSSSPASEQRRRDIDKDATFYKKLPTTAAQVVVEKNDFSQKAFNTWNSSTDSLENFYCINNGNVYLVIGNNENNTIQSDGNTSVAINGGPTHTFGIEKKAGYEYLFLFSTESQDSVTMSSNLWIPVPKTSQSLSFYSGGLLEKKIDIDLLSSIDFTYDNPTIPILSDTGSGASITLVTVPTTKSGTTTSKRKFKIVGIQAVAGSGYQDFNLEESLSASLSNETAAIRSTIETAITVGFVSTSPTPRRILQANHTLITASISSTEIASITDQTKFFSHGLVQGLETSSGDPLFSKQDTVTLKSNNVKITTAKTPLLSVTAADQIGSFGSALTLVSGATTNQKVTLASSKVSGSNLASEAQVSKNPFNVGNGIKSGKNGATFIITALTEPEAKEGTGTVINIQDTNFEISGSGSVGDQFPKTFVTQYLNRYN